MSYLKTSTSEFFEIISYDLFLTGIGFACVGALTHFSGAPLTDEMSAAGTFLILMALLFWRVQTSVMDRETHSDNSKNRDSLADD